MSDAVALAEVGRKVRQKAQRGEVTFRRSPTFLDAMRRAGIEDIDLSLALRTGRYSELIATDRHAGTVGLKLEARLDDGTPLRLEIEVFEAEDGDGDPQKMNVRFKQLDWPMGKSERRKETAKRLKLVVVRKERK
jgi:hypothetical protein